MRREYHQLELVEDQVHSDPLSQFQRWFEDATESKTLEPNAMIVATVDAECRPSQRTVLLKHVDDEGFVFFTNYESRKGRDLAGNSNVSLLFFWPELERQVRILGHASMLAPERSDAYFAERPRGSQIGSMASPQSEVIPSRQWLAQRFARFDEDYTDQMQLRRPARWGGVIVVPREYEFWQGRPNRLHDRLRYRYDEEGWLIERLAP